MTKIIHTNNNYRNVGMLEVVNEPVRGGNSQTDSMRRTYYPTAWARIRAAEAALNISPNNRLHIQMMVLSCLSSVYNIHPLTHRNAGHEMGIRRSPPVPH